MSKGAPSYCEPETGPIRKPWHDRDLLFRWIPLSIGLLIWYLMYYRWQVSFNVWISVGAVCWAIVGKALDTFTTHALFRLRPLLHSRGLDFPFVETNPFLPPHPTLRQLIFSWPSLLEFLSWVASFLGPPIGFFMGFAHMAAAFNNWMYRRTALASLKASGNPAEAQQT